MKTIAWITDIHLNFVNRPQIVKFFQQIDQMRPDAVLLGGDIGDARTVEGYLKSFENIVKCPIYFVLGNHDYYHGSIAAVRAKIMALTKDSRWLHWLPMDDIAPLSEKTCLMGCESWADGRLGEYATSSVILNDYLFIRELSGLDADMRLKRLKALADASAAGLAETLPKALEGFQHIILLTHVPPFAEACRHLGRPTDKEWLPHFTCKAVGDVITSLIIKYPDREMTVLCGHTHDAFQIRVRPNVHVRVGGASYGMPRVQEFLSIG
jgi:predicted MPP superfamily phosphohydrolase